MSAFKNCEATPERKIRTLSKERYFWLSAHLISAKEKLKVVTWEYHDFDDYIGSGELLMRQFIVGGMVYAIGFQRLQSVDELLNKGIDEKHNIPGFQMPQTGLWTVAFDKVENQECLEAYQHVELNSGQILKVITSVARAIFDHYNVSRSGAYYWCAAPDLSGKRKLISLIYMMVCSG
ncbi:hypothetical protein ABRQ05_20550 [Pectobacterium actinidiae]